MRLELTHDELQCIVAQASSLWERMRHPEAFGPAELLSRKAEARLRQWREIVAGGDVDLFRKRFSFDSLDEDNVRRFLGDILAPQVFDLPLWAEVLNDVLRETGACGQFLSSLQLYERYPFLEMDSPVPFEELLLPFVTVAVNRIGSATADAYSSIPARVRGGLERSLLQNCSRICSRVLEVEFRTHLACRQLDGLPYPVRGCESREAYLDFVAHIYQSTWLPLFKEYCVMARLMAVAVLQWVESTVEFLGRFSNDQVEIRQAIFGGADPGDLADVRMDMSDSHHGGRSVIALEFSSGRKLVYKPKDMGLEAEYFRFIGWLNGLGEALPFQRLRILEREGYGWVEFISNLACESESEVHRFYRRTGAFLCLIHACNGIDFHFENIVACGEQPVAVDLEAIYHHVTENATEDTDLTDAAAARLRDSVLATHLLPNPVKVNDRYYDISAIARSAEEETDFETPCWKHINTDGLEYDYEKIKLKPANNLPRFLGQYLSPDDYVGEIVDGFRGMYQTLCKHREELLADDSPFRRLFSHPARFIFRGTNLYVSAMKRAFHPDCMRDAIDFGIQLDVLSGPLIRAMHRPKAWPLVREEIEAFFRTDVPKFVARGDRDSLTLPSGEIVEGCFVDSAWNRVCAKILRFGDEDLLWQISLIKGSMDARDAKWLMGYPPGDDDSQDAPELLDAAGLVENAMALALAIKTAAVRSENREPGWLILKFLPDREQFALRSMEFDLYNGRCGLALFFAALEKVRPGSGFGGLAHATLAIVRRWLARADSSDMASLGLGGLVGIPSLAYALTRVGVFLGDPDLIAEAGSAARRISSKLIASDKALDLLGGAAGTILCLLACQQTGGGSEILDIASVCGRHLLEQRRMDRSGFRTWPTLGGRHLTGISHGAAGIAYALAKLFRATGERMFLDAAIEGIRFESCEFDPTKNNWPDHREYRNPKETPAGRVFMVRWCHGAPGIGLARLGSLAELDSPEIRNDIRAALEATRGCGLLPRDHICCGNMGLAETFLTAGNTLGEPSWTREALRITSRVVARARRKGSFGITFRNGFTNPCLFQGAAGVGYQMLRVAFPREIPAVLLLE